MKEKVKKFLFRSINFRKTYLLLLIVLSLGLAAIYFSYALFTVSVEKKGVLNIAAANLYPSLSSDALDENNQITLAPGENKQFEVTIENINSIDAYFQLYYKATSTGSVPQTDVSVGIGDCDFSQMKQTNNLISKYGSSNDKKTVTIVAKNYYYVGVTVEIGLKVGIEEPSINASDGEYSISTGMSCLPNKPELLDNMYAILGNDDGTWEMRTNDPSIDINLDYDARYWYDYEEQIWANAATFSSMDSVSTTPFTNINMNYIRTMWVWIPRYEYKINGTYGTHTDGTAGTASNPGAIDIIFIGKDVTTPHEGYRIHPAFTYNGEELAGIWVAKFVTGGNMPSTCTDSLSCTLTDVMIKPDVLKIANQNLGTMVSLAEHSDWAGTGFSFQNMHVLKASEWGAVAYLSQSKYGKYGNEAFTGANKQVYYNNSSYTGRSYGVGAGNTWENTSPGVYNYYGMTCSSSSVSSCTGTRMTNSGTGASTTGNISGIYDMASNTGEYVMGNYNNYLGSMDIDYVSSNWFNDYPNLYNKFTSTSETSACNGQPCYGYALKETYGWYDHHATWNPYSGVPWLYMGQYGNIFNYQFSTGSSGLSRYAIIPQS